MIALGEIERALAERRDLSVLEAAHLHRAWREDAWGHLRGRDRIRDAALAALAEEPRGTPVVDAEADRMIAVTAPGGWRAHRWVWREGGRILRETVVIDGAARARLLGRDPGAEAARIGAGLPIHPAYGELRAGRGQLTTSDAPELPPGFPGEAAAAAAYLHRFWNARALGLAPAEWRGPAEAGEDAAAFAIALLAQLPDAVCLVEDGAMVGDRVALLWRLHGHAPGVPGGRRIRLIGSSLIRMDGARAASEDMLIDTLAIAATAHRPLVDYAG